MGKSGWKTWMEICLWEVVLNTGNYHPEYKVCEIACENPSPRRKRNPKQNQKLLNNHLIYKRSSSDVRKIFLC